MFPQSFIQFLITLALIWTGSGALALIVLLIRDYRRRELW